MHVSRVGLVDFRSYHDVVVELQPGVTAFVGRNGVGKTNLIEGLGYAATLGSHRVAADAPLVRLGAERALVRVEVQRDGRPTLIEIEIVPGRANRARLNRAPVSRPREVLGVLHTVLFAPEDLALVKGDPGDRRRFLDDLLMQRLPRYAGVRADYDRILKQRNALLKSAGAARGAANVESTLEVWDEQLAQTGAELMLGRLQLLSDLAPPAAAAYEALAPGGGDLVLAMTSAVLPESELAAQAAVDRSGLADRIRDLLASRRREELVRGITLSGPHRDDLSIALGPHPAKGYASHGESWSCALALRLASYDLLRAEAAAGDPVLLLDDVFAELDAQRRERLAERVAGAEQVLITAAVAEDVPEALQGSHRVVQPGSVAGLDPASDR